jgi:16S rRNA processing protein RimM
MPANLMSLPEWSLTIGEIVAPFGLAGEVKVRLETDFPERFKRLSEVCLRFPNGDARLYPIERTRPHGDRVVMKLRGIDSIDTAQTLRNTMIQVRADEAVKLPENEFYIYDLVGCEVVTEAGQALGKLSQVLRSAANDVYLISGPNSSEILLPAVRDVVRHVDIANRKIVVSPTPGLLPEEAETA